MDEGTMDHKSTAPTEGGDTAMPSSSSSSSSFNSNNGSHTRIFPWKKRRRLLMLYVNGVEEILYDKQQRIMKR